MSGGEISIQTTPSKSYIGSIVGQVDSDTYINYCYYTNDLSEYDLYGTGTPSSSSYTLSYDNITFELSDDVSIGSYTETSLIDALNAFSDYYFLLDYSKWLLNKEEKSVTFTINGRTSSITMDSQIILLPSLANEGSLWFNGWYIDNEYINLLELFEITEDKTFYGKFEENTNNYAITFDTRREGVTVEPITAQYNSVVSLPSDLIREYCSVAFWETEHGENIGLSLTMSARNFTLYAVWKCTHIETPEDFIDFSKIVNSGTDYSGTTVLLDSDLSLPEINEPINNFLGAFDGQEHIISDLKVNSSSEYTGLFGYSTGSTIRNVVLDSSCSITNSYSGSSAYIGGIIGHCYARSGECNIENNVNMADVTFNGAVEYFLLLGGIAGKLSSSGYSIYVKNCANYGFVTHSGTSKNSYIGGIVGEFGNSYYKYAQNSLNYGTITHSGTTTNLLYLGGIVGNNKYAYIENCVCAGEIITNQESSCIGSIVGYVDSSTYINYCYYSSDVGINNLYGYGTPSSITETSDSPTDVDSGLVGKLNSNATSCNWNKWLLNKDNKSVSFIINYGKGFTVKSQVILLPDLVDNSERTFGGWYKDVNLTKSFFSNSIDSDTTLYGMFCGYSYAVTLDVNGGSELAEGENIMNFECNGYYGDLPENLERDGYTFDGWSTDKNGDEKVESGDKITRLYNHTLYAHWLNKYTVTFNATGGSVSITSMNVTFSYEYGNLPEDATKDGYTFDGWFTKEEDGKKIESITIVTTSSNHILYAHWLNVYTVTFDATEGNVATSSKNVTFSHKYGDLPEDATRDGYTFDGWFTKEEGGEKVNSTTAVTTSSNHILYAYWTPKNYTVIFDATGGSVSTSSMNVTFSREYGNLPEDATKDGYTFNGWFTKEEGGEKVESTTTVTISSNHILYAHWTENKVESSSEFSKDWASALYPLIQIISLLI